MRWQEPAGTAESGERTIRLRLPRPHAYQRAFIGSSAKRRIVRAGRRSGKTVGAAILACTEFLAKGRRVLYAAPTVEQIGRFWLTCCRALEPLLDAGVVRKNETSHVIGYPGRRDEARIKCKTAWNADTLRGDYADLLILDEWQLINEDAWGLVGAPMLLDNNGDAVFIYTPPSIWSRSISKAKDPQHAAKMFLQAQQDRTGRWAAYHWTSHDNPYISKDALSEITQDMTALSYRMEIMAEDVFEAPGAIWARETIERHRVSGAPADLVRVVIGVDPAATSTGDEAGIVAAGLGADGDVYILGDHSLQGSPLAWAQAAVAAYLQHGADRIVAEANQGGEMVAATIRQVDESVPIELVHASRGKAVRAEPVAARYEAGRVHHVGSYPYLEDELCLWTPGSSKSPNRLDALVWAVSALVKTSAPGLFFVDVDLDLPRAAVTDATP